MKIELVVSGDCDYCLEAQRVWREIAAERDMEFALLDISLPRHAELLQRLKLQTVPALLLDGVLRAVGVQSRVEALALIRDTADSAPHPENPQRTEAHDLMQRMGGMGFSPANRRFVMFAQAYLMLAGLGLLIDGSLLSDGPSRPAFLHLFTLGFMAFLIYGLGGHMLPRFTGNPIREGAWAWVQMGLAHAGVGCFAAGYFAGETSLVIMGAILAWLSLALFTLRVWPVLWPRRRQEFR